MTVVRSFFLALSGGVLFLGGVEHLRRRGSSNAVLALQSARALPLARVAAGRATAVGTVMTAVGAVAVVAAAAPAPQRPIAVVTATAVTAIGTALVVHAGQVLRHGDLPCGCLGADAEPMTPVGLAPSASVALGGAIALAAGATGGTGLSALEAGSLAALGVQAAAVVGLVTLTLGHAPSASPIRPGAE